MDSSLTLSLYRQAEKAGKRGYLVVGVLTALGYGLTAAPDLYWRDSGELTAAGFGLGVAHPTGFPLYLMLVRAASMIPIGSVAFRVALLSTVLSALTVGLVYKLVEEMLVAGDVSVALRRFGAFGASISMASVEFFWRTGTVPEVYAATTAMLAGGLLLFWRMLFRPRPQTALAGLFVAGLGSVGLHSILRWSLVLPWLILWFWYLLRTKARWPKLAGFFFVLGAGCLVQLPIRAHVAPFMDWGHAATLGALWEHVTGWRIRQAFASQMLSLNKVWFFFHLKEFLFLMWDQTLGLWPILLLLGLVSGMHRAKWRVGAVRIMILTLTWVLLTDFVYGFWVNPMGMEDLQNGFAMLLAGSVLVGLGLVAASSFLAQSLPALAVASSAVLVFITILPPAISNWKSKVGGADWGASAWSRAVSDQAAPGALVVVASDDLAAGLSYLQAVEDKRPDMVVLVRQHAWDAVTVERSLSRAGWPARAKFLLSDWSARPRKTRMVGSVSFVGALIHRFEAQGRQVLWEPVTGPETRAVGNLNPGTPLFFADRSPMLGRFAVRSSRRGERADATAHASSPGVPADDNDRNLSEHLAAQIIQATSRILYGQESAVTRRTGARHLTAAGRWAYRMATRSRSKGKLRSCLNWTDAAIMLFHAALKFRLSHAPALVNLGAALALRATLLRASDSQRALLLMERALAAVQMGLEQEPLSRSGLLNAAKFALTLGQWTSREDYFHRARKLLQRAWSAGYHDAKVAFTMGVVEANLSHMRQAGQWFERALRADPKMKAARIYLDRVRKESGGGR